MRRQALDGQPVAAETRRTDDAAVLRSLPELIGAAIALGATELGPLSRAEQRTAARASALPDQTVAALRERIARGDDPLGEAFCSLFSRAERRPAGATYTPAAIVHAMTAWGAARKPGRVIDPGAGSGRFLVAAGRALPHAELLAIEKDPLAALLARAHLSAAGLSQRARVELADYRTIALPRLPAATLYLGNPPYIRHHLIGQRDKRWLTRSARSLGLHASQLAGLHAHFFLATALHARAGDAGAFVTAAEWLDVNYGSLVRGLLLGPLGATALHLIEPTALPFADADTTAVITCFEVGARAPSIGMRRVASAARLRNLAPGSRVPRARLEAAARWTPLTRARRNVRSGCVELGELCRVHRGQVTGANRIWIAGEHSCELPEALSFPSVTRARELFAAGAALTDASQLRRVIDLPGELDALPAGTRRRVERFLRRARALGADRGFIARHRKAWWSVGLREPAPILASYMARRPPAFVRNLAGARHINIAHGIYPREPMDAATLTALAHVLSRTVTLGDGRTYAGGLTKFEPREMERLLVPRPELLAAIS